MKKRTKLMIAAVAAVFFVSVVLSVWILHASPQNVIEIVQDGEILYTFDLSKAENQTLRIASPDGSGYNLVVIENGTVRIMEADCPDQTCVHMGTLQSDLLPLVCLPHRLIVRFAEEAAG